MKTIEKEKTFDAVAFMRQQRDSLSEKLLKMTKEEIIGYFREKAATTTVSPVTNKNSHGNTN
jgi:predicted secreted protein